MGAYANCWIGGLLVAATKNGLDPSVLCLFDPPNRMERRSDDPGLPTCVAEDLDEDPDDDAPFNVVYFETTTKIARERLDLDGYTFENARGLFDESMRLQASESDERSGPTKRVRLPSDQWLTYTYLRAYGSLPSDNEHPYGPLSDELVAKLGRDGTWLESCPDPLVELRLALEVCAKEPFIVYNATNLIRFEELREEDSFDEGTDNIARNSLAPGTTVVLTEGRTDAWILEESMQLLYPHLAARFSFMDFSEFRVPGGAGPLANLVKAFAAAGILNRVIAVFDNDTAAAAAQLSLRTIKLPSRIVTLTLPDIPLLRGYPTMGPTGPATMNVNGMAASIELYLGLDSLGNPDGTLPPIQWTGYESTLERYQGELTNKLEVQARFREKLRRAREDNQYLRAADWTGIHAIFDTILRAFHSLDGRMLLTQLQVFYR